MTDPMALTVDEREALERIERLFAYGEENLYTFADFGPEIETICLTARRLAAADAGAEGMTPGGGESR